MDASKLRAASLSDAMRRLHPHAHHVLGLVSATPGRAILAPAATMLFAPVRADAPKGHDFETMLRSIPDARGKPLVCAAPGADDAAVAGGIRLLQIARAGFAGLVTSARLRDLDEARAMDLALWCRGETPFAGSAQAMPVATQIPIALGNATVMPGDHLYASDAGAVIIPARDLERVLSLAAEIERADAERARKIGGG